MIEEDSLLSEVHQGYNQYHMCHHWSVHPNSDQWSVGQIHGKTVLLPHKLNIYGVHVKTENPQILGLTVSQSMISPISATDGQRTQRGPIGY